MNYYKAVVVQLFMMNIFRVSFSEQITRDFNCVLPTLCLDLVVDPRAVAPVVDEIQTHILSSSPVSSDVCPTGTVQCHSIKCGSSSVTPNSQSGLVIENSLPWQAYLRDDTRNVYVGSGVLIDQYNVLTAAHKISNLTAPGTILTVLMGVFDPTKILTSPSSSSSSPSIQISQVLRAYKHINYDEKFLKNDVAILRLETPMALTSSVMTICLPSSGISFIPPNSNNDNNCLVGGWGQSDFTNYDAPTVFKQTYLPIVTAEECKNSFANLDRGELIVANFLDVDNGNQLCAGGQAKLDSCTQDGGAPLICNSPSSASFTLAGLVLWGKGCGEMGRFGVYLNVPNYLSWIENTAECSTLMGSPNNNNCLNATTQNFS